MMNNVFIKSNKNEKEIIIFIDLQNDFQNMITNEYEQLLEKLLKYLYVLKKDYMFIKSNYFEINFENETFLDRLDGTHMGKKICIKDTTGSEIIDKIKFYTNDSNTIIKKYYSAFKMTNLHSYLQSKNITTLIFAGLTVNTCIKATIIDGIKLGYKIKIIDECVTSINEKMKTKGLDDLSKNYNVDIVKLENIINGFEIYCEGDTFLINDIFSNDIYSDLTFEQIIEECNWKTMKINGGTLAREIDVQSIKNDNLMPVYRNPSDEYIEPHEPTPIIKKMFDWLNNNLNLYENKFNHVFIKYYKSCVDGIGKHSDKTLDLGLNSYIGNLSLGSKRKMKFTSKISKEVIEIPLKTNSILFIGMKTNKKWFHEVKPDLRQEKFKSADELAYETRRVSLTFRTVCTFMNLDTKKISGQGAPTNNDINIDDIELLNQDKKKLIEAFSKENKLADFDWNKYYSCGFYSLNT
jgi:nicotinamidase-related amidase/alkylated DNA repair dioxygenase AlkB